MPTHFNDRIPKEEYQGKWFLFNAFSAPQKTITPQLVVKILNAGYTRIYVSMGAKFANQQMELQKEESFNESLKLLEGRSFEIVVLDCINAPFQNISCVLPSINNVYLMGENKTPFYKAPYGSWQGKCYIPRLLPQDSQEMIILNEFRNGPLRGLSEFTKTANHCWQNIK